MVNRFTSGLKRITGYCALVVATIAGAGISAFATSPTTTFNYTGSVQSYIVPGGITSLNISVSGGSGGNGDFAVGGNGGTTSATLAVTPGQVIYVFVGGKGNNSLNNGGGTTFGYNGGGTFGGVSATSAGGGGGASDVRVGATDLFSRVLVAGGGGGGGMTFAGGDGGGLIGAVGFSGGTGAGGGTQATGGAGENGAGNSGSVGVGGDIDATETGGGGGGGYNGGGGGADAAGGGGGGSSYAGLGTSSVAFTQGGNIGNGVVTITPIGTISHSPTFTHGGSQSLVVCQNSVATPINTLLQINDLDPGNTETWTVISGPTNGTVAIGPTSTSLGGNLTPYGFSYTPTTGYSGTDVFTVQISDGTNVATTEISVTINTIAPIFGANTVCIGANTALSNTLGGGIWTSSIPSAALIGASTGIVTGVVASTVLISYTNTSGCTATKVITVNANPAGITGPSSICVGFSASYTDIAPGGIWSTGSSNISLDGSGNVAALTSGLAAISYQMPATGCYAVRNINVADLPAPITGPSIVCLGASVFLTDATPGGVSWKSNDTSIAKVTNSGVVTGGYSTGTTTITYSISSGCYITKTMTTMPLPPGITGNAPVCAGSSYVLSNPAGPGTWNSGSPSVASVAGDGTVTGIAGGTATIYYIDGNGCKTSVTATVNAILPITGTLATCAGWPTSLVDATPGGTWSSGNTGVAIISATGVVTGVSAGTALISYTIPTGCVRTAVVTVGAGLPPITGTTAICQGTTTTLSDAAGSGTWSSSAPSTVSVNTYGIITGINTGIATITYTTSTCRAVQTVTVNANPSNIAGAIKVCTTYSITLSNLVGGGVWSGSNASASIDAVGTVTGIAPGTVVATYTLPSTGCFKNYTVTVNGTPTPIGGVLSVCTGTVTHLTDATNPGLSWTSSTPSVATINAGGNMTAVSTGTTRITYTLNTGCYVTAVATVNPNPAAPAAITGPSSVSRSGAGINLSDATPGGVWTSGNMAVLTVDAVGHVTAVAIAGSTNINYIMTNGFGCTSFATKVITATPAPHDHGGMTTTVGAFVEVKDEAMGGEWSSSDNSVATVDANGMVSALAPGSVIITHTISSNGEQANNTTTILVNALPIDARMFPNPNKGSFSVKGTLGSTKDAAVAYEITNMLGQVVYSNNTIATGGMINEQVSLSSFTSGMYLLTIKSGKETKAIHFVIE